jgi:hypothetical protein
MLVLQRAIFVADSLRSGWSDGAVVLHEPNSPGLCTQGRLDQAVGRRLRRPAVPMR